MDDVCVFPQRANVSKLIGGVAVKHFTALKVVSLSPHNFGEPERPDGGVNILPNCVRIPIDH